MVSTREYIESFPCTKALCIEQSDQIDPMGNHWCDLHSGCHQIMRYGALRGWTTIETEYYALGPEYSSYLFFCTWGKKEILAKIEQEMANVTKEETNTSDEP